MVLQRLEFPNSCHGIGLPRLNRFTQCDTIRALRSGTTDALARVIVYAEVAKLVDALDLGSSVLRRESSSLSFRTKFLHGLLSPTGRFNVLS